MATTKQKIRPFLWFNQEAEEAARYYVGIFKNSKITKVSHYPEGGPYPAGTVMTVEFELDGNELIALNGGPEFKFTEAISLAVSCENQKEVDDLWRKLTANGGQEMDCGWLKDKYGLAWQIIPQRFLDMITDEQPEKAQRAFGAMMKMKKLDLAKLEEAYRSRPA